MNYLKEKFVFAKKIRFAIFCFVVETILNQKRTNLAKKYVSVCFFSIAKKNAFTYASQTRSFGWVCRLDIITIKTFANLIYLLLTVTVIYYFMVEGSRTLYFFRLNRSHRKSFDAVR